MPIHIAPPVVQEMGRLITLGAINLDLSVLSSLSHLTFFNIARATCVYFLPPPLPPLLLLWISSPYFFFSSTIAINTENCYMPLRFCFQMCYVLFHIKFSSSSSLLRPAPSVSILNLFFFFVLISSLPAVANTLFYLMCFCELFLFLLIFLKYRKYILEH